MSNVLGELFGDIATAIREKTGDTATMKPAEFPKKISGIENSNVLDNVEIIPDFSNGNMIESLPEGYSAKSATIIKPETLVPDNIAEGVTIAGILGTYASGGGGDSGEKSIVYARGKGEGMNVGQSIDHNLGVVPDLILLATRTDKMTTNGVVAIICFSKAFKEKAGLQYGQLVYQTNGNAFEDGSGTIESSSNTFEKYYSLICRGTTTRFELTYGSMASIPSGTTFNWIALGNIV